MQRMSFQEYADHRGITLQAVRKAAKDGRISYLKDMMTGAPYVYKEEADDQWVKNSGEEKGKETKKRHSTWNKEDSEYPAYAESRSKKEFYLAEKARIEYEEQLKQLVRADEVKSEMLSIFRSVRESMLTIPDRLAAQLAGETRETEVYKVLADEIREAMEALTSDDTPNS